MDTTSQMLTLASSELVLGQMNPYVINLLVGGFVLVSIVMILIVLIQRPQGGGLGGAFGAGGSGGGGGGAGQTAFGTKTGDVLTGGTIAIFVMFVVFAVILNFATRPQQAPQARPTIASPTTTEPIPADDEAGLVDTLGDLVEENLENSDAAPTDAADEVVEESATPTEPDTNP